MRYERVPLDENAADGAGAAAASSSVPASSPSSAPTASSSPAAGAAGESTGRAERGAAAVGASATSWTLASTWAWLQGPAPPADDTPASRARAFVASLRRAYGVPASARLPAFAECAHGEALARAERALKPLLVYLHSSVHEDSPAFVREALASPAFVALADSAFVSWAGGVQERDGAEAAARFEAAAFPFLAVYTAAPESTAARPRYVRVWASEGAPDVAGGSSSVGEALAAQLRAGCAAALTTLETMAAERASRVYERNLRSEQDREYLEAEARDIAAMRAREAEEAAGAAAAGAAATAAAAAAAGAEEAAELAAAIELSQQLHRESEVDAARRRLAARPEPPAPAPGAAAAGGDVAAIRFTLPSGARIQRRFGADEPLAALRDYVLVAAHELRQPLLHFDLGTTFPRRSFPEPPPAAAADAAAEPPQSIRAAGLFPQAVVFVTQTAAQRERERLEAGGGAAATG